ncbi:hypothetical protein FsymDg_0319 [Candidatus Protofrankia datiscae]|uniref:Uncharacterized protein n=1 Tax=Candidatus Protofrankia datiscae TaxID=2716812 RepID=F8B3P7_9ACTN|nr:hypothetical protein FsymDg_0319 [Candidatus Protofrankia datiscae]
MYPRQPDHSADVRPYPVPARPSTTQMIILMVGLVWLGPGSPLASLGRQVELA